MADGVSVGALYATLKLDESPFRRSVSSAGGLFGDLAGIAVKGGAIITGALAGLGLAAAHNADEQERADARVQAVLGKSADAFIAWTGKNALALRVADDALEDYGAKAIQTFQGVGISTADSVKMTETLMQRAADISAQTGKSFDEVYSALLKGTGGATKGLKDLGIVVDRQAIQQEALKLKLWDGKGALSAAAQAAAIYQLELDRSSSAAGAAAARSGSMAEQMKALPVLFDKIMDALGRIFLPLVNAILPSVTAAFADLADWVDAHMADIQSVIQTVSAAIAAAFGFVSSQVLPALGAAFGFIVDDVLPPLVQAFQFIKDNADVIFPGIAAILVAVVVPAFVAWATAAGAAAIATIAALAPVLIPVAAIGAAVGLLALAWKENFGGIREIVGNVIGFVRPILEGVASVLFPALGKAAEVLGAVIGTAFKVIGAVLTAAWDVAKGVATGIGTAFGALVGVFQTVGSAITGVFRGAMNFLIGLVNGIIRAVDSIQVHIDRIGLDVPGVGFVGVGPFDWPGLQLKQLPYLAKGGVVTSPTFAMIGEGGRREAVIPLDDPRFAGLFERQAPQQIIRHGPYLTVQGDLRAKDEPSVLVTLQRMAEVAG